MYDIKPTDVEIDEQLNKAYEQEEKGGSKWPGMSYEQGVRTAIDWITGNTDELPIEDD